MWMWLWGCATTTPTPDDTSGPGDTAVTAVSEVALRVATWNIEGLGAPGSEQYVAARQVLQRIDADVVGLNEIAGGEEDALVSFAADLGYQVVQPRTNPFGSSHNAVLSRLGVEQSAFPSSAVLADDPSANDITRWPVSVAVEAPWGEVVAITTQHCKAGFDLDDAFRRTLDTRRLGQAAQRVPADRTVAMGDLNADLAELQSEPPSPSRWTFPPGGLPPELVIGDDVEAILGGEGLPNDPFVLLDGFGLTVVDAVQPDGRSASRDSGRLIDYVLVGDGLRASASEIFDSRDESFDDGITKAGEPLERPVSRLASDHFPVVVDLRPE
ncbi:MAG: endonuclease/exonuclease/phosphatase family protein [Myxococcota bacterium]